MCCFMVCFVRGVCACVVLACVACGVLCDVVWFVFVVVFVCLGVLLICVCDLSMMYYALSHGLCLCCCVFVRVGLNVFVRFVCDSICDAV